MGLLGDNHVVVQVVSVSMIVKVTVLFGGSGKHVAQVPGLANGPEVSMLIRVQEPSMGGA